MEQVKTFENNPNWRDYLTRMFFEIFDTIEKMKKWKKFKVFQITWIGENNDFWNFWPLLLIMVVQKNWNRKNAKVFCKKTGIRPYRKITSTCLASQSWTELGPAQPQLVFRLYQWTLMVYSILYRVSFERKIDYFKTLLRQLLERKQE